MGRLDLAFKTLDERSPRTMLDLFGHTPLDEATRFEPVERELALNLRSIDQAFILERDGERWVEHFEAEMVLSRSSGWTSPNIFRLILPSALKTRVKGRPPAGFPRLRKVSIAPAPITHRG